MEQGQHTEEGTRGMAPNANVQSAVAQLWEVIRRAGEILVSVQDDNRALTAKVAALEQHVSGHEEHTSGTRAEIDALQAELAQRDESIAALRSEINDTERERKAGDEAAAELRDRVERYEETIRRFTLRIGEQDEEIAALKLVAEEHQQGQQELAGAAERETALQAAIGELREKLAVAVAASKDTEFLRAELVRRNTELNARINEALYHKERAAELENKLFELPQVQTALRETRSTVSSLGEELAAAKQAHADAEQRAGMSAEQCSDLQQHNEELRQQLAQSHEMEQELLARIQQHHDDNDIVRSRAEEQQKHIVELSEQLIRAKAQLHEHEKSSAGSTADTQAFAAELENARLLAEKQAEQNRAISEELDTTKQAYQAVCDECAALRSQCAEQAEELQAVARLSVSRDVIEEKEAQIAELLAQVEEKEREGELLRRRLDDVQTVGSLFSAARYDGNSTTAHVPAADDRAEVIASVQALLQKVEHVLRADPGDSK